MTLSDLKFNRITDLSEEVECREFSDRIETTC